MITIQQLADTLVLGDLMSELRTHTSFQFLDHWKQGEFHHDTVFKLDDDILPGKILVVSTNCNGGIKEVLNFHEVPSASALWHWRCPDSPEFEGELPEVLARAVTHHHFDPCELLKDDARTELREEFKERQAGGGWKMKGCKGDCDA